MRKILLLCMILLLSIAAQAQNPFLPNANFDGEASRPVVPFKSWIEEQSTAGNKQPFDLDRRSNMYMPACKTSIDAKFLQRYPNLTQLCEMYKILTQEYLTQANLDGKKDLLSMKIAVKATPKALSKSACNMKSYYGYPEITIQPEGSCDELDIFASSFHEMNHAIFTTLIRHSVDLRAVKIDPMLRASMEDFLGDLLALYMTGDPMRIIADPTLKQKEINLRLLSIDIKPADITKLEDTHYYLSPLHRIVYPLYQKDRDLKSFERILRIFLAQLKTLSLRYAGQDIRNLEDCTAINSALTKELEPLNL